MLDKQEDKKIVCELGRVPIVKQWNVTQIIRDTHFCCKA